MSQITGISFIFMDITFKFLEMESNKQNFEAFKAPQADPPAFV